VPWRGMGCSTSHREKMAIMETVVSTTMRYAVLGEGGVVALLMPHTCGASPHACIHARPSCRMVSCEAAQQGLLDTCSSATQGCSPLFRTQHTYPAESVDRPCVCLCACFLPAVLRAVPAATPTLCRCTHTCCSR
jgi:hypothetical protein